MAKLLLDLAITGVPNKPRLVDQGADHYILLLTFQEWPLIGLVFSTHSASASVGKHGSRASAGPFPWWRPPAFLLTINFHKHLRSNNQTTIEGTRGNLVHPCALGTASAHLWSIVYLFVCLSVCLIF